MALANILVHLDSRPRTAARVGLSLRIAERCGARLTGMFAEKADAHLVGTVATWPSAHYVAARDKAQAAFAAATAPLKDRAAFIDVNRGSDHEIIRRATEIARTFDLVVLGQAQDDVPVPAKLPDEVIAESGRPVLVVPYVGTYADVGARPLFAWHGERGAARAAFDALPLLTERLPSTHRRSWPQGRSTLRILRPSGRQPRPPQSQRALPARRRRRYFGERRAAQRHFRPFGRSDGDRRLRRRLALSVWPWLRNAADPRTHDSAGAVLALRRRPPALTRPWLVWDSARVHRRR